MDLKGELTINFLKFKKTNCRFLFLFAIANCFLFCLVSLRYLTITLSSSTLFATGFYKYETLLGKKFVLLFVISTYLGHFSLLAFLPLIPMMLSLLFINRPKIIVPLAICVWSISIMILFADIIIFYLFHFHLNFSLIKILFN